MSVERLNDDVETVETFCYLGDGLNARSGSKMTTVTSTRIGWIRFCKCGKVFYERRVSLKMKR